MLRTQRCAGIGRELRSALLEWTWLTPRALGGATAQLTGRSPWAACRVRRAVGRFVAPFSCLLWRILVWPSLRQQPWRNSGLDRRSRNTVNNSAQPVRRASGLRQHASLESWRRPRLRHARWRRPRAVKWPVYTFTARSLRRCHRQRWTDADVSRQHRLACD